MKKSLALLLVPLVLLSLIGCGKTQQEKIHPQYYELGKEALGLAEAYLDGSISLADAKTRAESIDARLDALPLIPKEDPLYEKSHDVAITVSLFCSSFSLAKEGRDLALRETLTDYSPLLAKDLGLRD